MKRKEEMMRIVLKRILPALAAVTWGLAPLVASAQSAADYPNKVVRIIVPFGAGGPTDIFGRMFSAYLNTKYKANSYVENKPGAGSLVGADLVARSAPDGYTLLCAANSLAYESLLNKDSPIDTTKALVPVGIIGGSGLFIGVSTQRLPDVKTMPELIAWIKANPGKLDQGIVTGSPLVEMEYLRDKLGLKWTNVSYKGGAATNTALMAGEVHMYTPDLNQAIPGVKEGKVRLLAYTEKTRHPAMPDVPTVAESGIGVPDFESYIWLGMYAPAKTPQDILTKLNADVNELSQQPDSVARL
ncbi:MAG TPA: tripartite tricarboxylate transporter substrate-binding protein, partial [Burkholderiales bacterium]|nr:tripartite tricarboxylate transporter substrate-binding protein [Burkholderiales bacterium]